MWFTLFLAAALLRVSEALSAPHKAPLWEGQWYQTAYHSFATYCTSYRDTICKRYERTKDKIRQRVDWFMGNRITRISLSLCDTKLLTTCFLTSKTEIHDNVDFCKKPDSGRPEQTTLKRFSPQRRGHSADYCLSIFLLHLQTYKFICCIYYYSTIQLSNNYW